MKTKIIILLIIIFISTSTISLAVKEDLNSLTVAINKNKNVLNILSGEGKATFEGMIKNFFDVTRIVVGGIIIIKLFSTTTNINEAANDPSKLSNLKSKALWRVLALVTLINFWNILRFAEKIMNNIRLL
ncbi:MAG: hypothetical protein M0Q88_02715 [Bacilli bacterium]|nr:hypothetical protein [Bacilli bacterium]